MRQKSVNTPLSHERLVGGLQDGGRGTHVTHFVQLYLQPLYTASQVRTTCRSWDEGVLTDVCLTGVLNDLCLILYNLGAGWGRVVNATSRPIYHSGKTRYPLYRRLVGSQGRSGRVHKISPPPGFDPRTVRPVANRDTDYAIHSRKKYCFLAISEFR